MAKTPAPSVTRPTAERETESRVTLPIDANGLIDVDRMQGRTKERVREWFANSALYDRLGVSAPVVARASAPDVLPDALVHTLIATLGQVSAAVVERVYGCTPEQAMLMHFSQGERDTLTPPMKNVLNKYGSTMLSKYGDEIALAALLTSTIANKAGSVQRAMQKAAPIPPVLVFPQSGEIQDGHETTGEVKTE